jgi:putative transposase
MTLQARNIVMQLEERAQPNALLIHDRDAKFTARFDDVFRTEGVDILRTPILSPKANAVAERWIRTARTECLDWLLITGPRHLHELLRSYVEHYNRARPHRGLDLSIRDPPSPAAHETLLLAPSFEGIDSVGSYTSMSERYKQVIGFSHPTPRATVA